MRFKCYETPAGAGPGHEPSLVSISCHSITKYTYKCSCCKYFHVILFPNKLAISTHAKMSTFTISLISVFVAYVGVCAQEVHLCGEASAIELVREFAHTVGDDFEVRRYKRLTPLTVMDKAIGMSL